MKKISTFIDSGILEAYVLGLTSNDENTEVETMAATHQEVRFSINAFEEKLEKQSFANAIAPPALVKTMVMASIDYMGRLGNGEIETYPPILEKGAKIIDYANWLNRPDMLAPIGFEGTYVKIISHTPQMTTAIAWITDMAPSEVHEDEFENFLVVEGTCDFTIGTVLHQLVAGDFLSIPLFQPHHFKVTSKCACKVVLQRIAA